MSLRTTSLTALALALRAQPTFACATCFGDPESPMAKGAVLGVYVLIGVVGFVLTGIAGTGLFWIRRSRRLGRAGVQDAASDL